MNVHPDIQKVLDGRGVRQLSMMTVEEARTSHFEGATAGPPGPDMAEVSDERIADVRVRVYRPVAATGAALVYFHGGGWVLGSIETHDRQCRQLADGSGATVFNVDYRRAPEDPFPAAYDDALAVTQWVLEAGASLGVDSARVGLAGDSAGGNLAAAVALACRETSAPSILAQLLVSPAVDAEMTSASYDENADGPFLSKRKWPGSTATTKGTTMPRTGDCRRFMPRTYPGCRRPWSSRPSSTRFEMKARPTPMGWPMRGCKQLRFATPASPMGSSVGPIGPNRADSSWRRPPSGFGSNSRSMARSVRDCR